MNIRLDNKVALVTGSSRGIGREVAIALAESGADVIINYTSEKSKEKAEEVVSIVKGMGKKSLAIQCDISDEKQVINMYKLATEAIGPNIDILINNAGIEFDVERVRDQKGEEWIKTYQVNVMGTFYCCKHALDFMSKERNPFIGITTSSNGLVDRHTSGHPSTIAYDASKAALELVMRDMMQDKEFRSKNVRFINFALGWIDTGESGINEHVDKDYLESERQRIVAGRFATVREVSNVYVFCASNEAAYLNGITIPIDGGFPISPDLIDNETIELK